jgi:hypothetical protein
MLTVVDRGDVFFQFLLNSSLSPAFGVELVVVPSTVGSSHVNADALNRGAEVVALFALVHRIFLDFVDEVSPPLLLVIVHLVTVDLEDCGKTGKARPFQKLSYCNHNTRKKIELSEGASILKY